MKIIIRSEINDFLVLGSKDGLYRKFEGFENAVRSVLEKGGLADSPGMAIILDEPGLGFIPVVLYFDNSEDNQKAENLINEDPRFWLWKKSDHRGFQ